MSRDWIRFHQLYDTWPPLQARLHAVQAQIESALETAPPGPIRILSLCAGDGRDLLGALSDAPRLADIDASLIDNHAELVARGETALAHLQLPASIRFLCADATLADTYLATHTYLALAPADLLIAAGVFGNLEQSSVQRLVHSLRSLCKMGSSVVWTHKTAGAADEYRIALLGRMLHEADFRERTVTRTEPPGFVIATHTYVGDPIPLRAGTKLFEFSDGASPE